ncbi:GNAT family N-acetyltransferase [Marilutibacter alkalisoli]|uniref:GNAT family N-acetyltransferase n=1 Tax=Marilutibacter alkalisoli TaxID=2591633 RepID=A0A514BWW4_9GAMM|nr:GNAT family N-acetyltransferase [Lysobacter alkalisoli]
MHQSEIKLNFVPITSDAIKETEGWFDDPDTQRFLGGREWVRRIPALLQDSPGAEFRGRRVLARYAWVVYATGRSVGIVDVERYDDRTAGIALAVAPAMRGKGIGRRILSSLETLDELAEVETFIGAVEPENEAARRCMRSARFEVAERVDEEGMLRISRSVAWKTGGS